MERTLSARSNPGFLRPFILLAAVALMATFAAPSVRADDASTDPPPEADADRIFAVHVLPLLKQKCFACHGNTPDDLKGELDLTSREALLEGGESGEPTEADMATMADGDAEKPLTEGTREMQAKNNPDQVDDTM